LRKQSASGSPYVSFRYLTAKEEKVIRIPIQRMPVLKLKWSATMPRNRGAPPIPTITPEEMMAPIPMDLSSGEVSFEIAARATGKKTRERAAWMKSVMVRQEKEGANARERVLSPVVRRPRKRIFSYP